MTRRPSKAVGRKTRRQFLHAAASAAAGAVLVGRFGQTASLAAPNLVRGPLRKDPLRNVRYLLGPKSSCQKEAHIHPFLSPDGSLAFFNSDESGILQAYMLRGLG